MQGAVDVAPPVDIGTTTLTGIQRKVLPGRPDGMLLGHSVLDTMALTSACSLKLGSDIVRTGLLFEPQETRDGVFEQ